MEAALQTDKRESFNDIGDTQSNDIGDNQSTYADDQSIYMPSLPHVSSRNMPPMSNKPWEVNTQEWENQEFLISPVDKGGDGVGKLLNIFFPPPQTQGRHGFPVSHGPSSRKKQRMKQLQQDKDLQKIRKNQLREQLYSSLRESAHRRRMDDETNKHENMEGESNDVILSLSLSKDFEAQASFKVPLDNGMVMETEGMSPEIDEDSKMMISAETDNKGLIRVVGMGSVQDIDFVVQELFDSSFSISLTVRLTGQDWKIFISSSAPSTTIMAIWRRVRFGGANRRIIHMLLDASSVKIRDSMIIESTFDSMGFKRWCQQEIEVISSLAALLIQKLARKFIATKRVKEIRRKARFIAEAVSNAAVRTQERKKAHQLAIKTLTAKKEKLTQTDSAAKMESDSLLEGENEEDESITGFDLEAPTKKGKGKHHGRALKVVGSGKGQTKGELLSPRPPTNCQPSFTHTSSSSSPMSPRKLVHHSRGLNGGGDKDDAVNVKEKEKQPFKSGSKVVDILKPVSKSIDPRVLEREMEWQKLQASLRMDMNSLKCELVNTLKGVKGEILELKMGAPQDVGMRQGEIDISTPPIHRNQHQPQPQPQPQPHPHQPQHLHFNQPQQFQQISTTPTKLTPPSSTKSRKNKLFPDDYSTAFPGVIKVTNANTGGTERDSQTGQISQFNHRYSDFQAQFEKMSSKVKKLESQLQEREMQQRDKRHANDTNSIENDKSVDMDKILSAVELAAKKAKEDALEEMNKRLLGMPMEPMQKHKEDTFLSKIRNVARRFSTSFSATSSAEPPSSSTHYSNPAPGGHHFATDKRPHAATAQRTPPGSVAQIPALKEIDASSPEDIQLQRTKETMIKVNLTRDEATIRLQRILRTLNSRRSAKRGIAKFRAIVLQRVIHTTSDMYIVNKALEAALLADSHALMTASVKKAIALYLQSINKSDVKGTNDQGGEGKAEDISIDLKTLIDLTNKYVEDSSGIPNLMELIFLSIKKVLPSVQGDKGSNAISTLQALLEDYYNAGMGYTLLNVCKQHTESIQLCVPCLRLISIFVTYHERGRMLIGQEAGCKALRAIFYKYQDKLPVCELAFGIIINLVRDNVGNQDRLGDVGMCNYIVEALQTHGKATDKICFAGFQALLGLCAKNHAINRDLICNGNNPSILQDLLSHYRQNVKVVEVICKTLVMLVSANKGVAKTFNKMGLASIIYEIVTNSETKCPPPIISLCLIILAFVAHHSHEDQRQLNESIRQLLIKFGNQHPSDEVRKNAKFAANMIFSNAGK